MGREVVCICFLIFLFAASLQTEFEQKKCTSSDQRNVYDNCALDYRCMTLWCDLTNFTRIPNPSKILSQAPASRTVTLYMNDSCIEDLDQNSLSNYPFLEILSFAKNSLTNVKNWTFAKVPHLRRLDLSWNSITELEEGAFSGLSELQVLDLSHNKITHLNENVLLDLIRLEELILDWNQLDKLDGKLFGEMSNLKRVRLKHNNIANCTTSKHLSFPLLESINLDENVLERLHPGCFVNMPSLKVLSVIGNNLTFVDDGTFNGLPNLEFIDLSRNRIKLLHKDSFAHLCHLLHLNLTANSLSTIHPEWLISLFRHKAMNGVGLRENNWSCDCEMMKFWRFINVLPPLSSLATLECQQPQKFFGKTLQSMTMNSFSSMQNCIATRNETERGELKANFSKLIIANNASRECWSKWKTEDANEDAEDSDGNGKNVEKNSNPKGTKHVTPIVIAVCFFGIVSIFLVLSVRFSIYSLQKENLYFKKKKTHFANLDFNAKNQVVENLV